MQKQSIIIDKLKELKEAAWKLPLGNSQSHRFARKYAAKTKDLINQGVAAVGKEAEETEKMARSFFKMLEAKLDLSGRTMPPSEEEVKEAIEQLKDVGRFSIFTTLVILPGGVVSLVGLELLAKKFGVKGFNLVPSSFRKDKKSTLPVKPGMTSLEKQAFGKRVFGKQVFGKRASGRMNIILIFCLLLFSYTLQGQKVFKVKYESQADLKVYVVEYESQCDLKVFFVEYESQADEDGLWYFVKYESQADKKIYFVDYESQADLKIFIVKYESQAGWNRTEKQHLLL